MSGVRGAQISQSPPSNSRMRGSGDFPPATSPRAYSLRTARIAGTSQAAETKSQTGSWRRRGADLTGIRGLLRSPRQRLEHAHPVTLRVHERHILPDAGNIPRLTQHLASRGGDLLS